MQYRSDRYGNPLSVLGFGCMRFSRKGSAIDLDKAEQELLAAYEAGVNYFDTAYLYPGSEALLGTVLQRNQLREKVHIATKLPQYLVNSAAAVDKFFQEELSRLQTTYIDYYLMHMLTDLGQWQKLERLGIREWIAARKAEGSIRQIGFSYHGSTEGFLAILNAYDWDFCQIQYNYLDETTQAGVEGLKAAAAKGLPVIIMEPLRGGKLVNLLPAAAREAIGKHPRGWTAAEWAFRWLYNQPEVTVVLSGMNSLSMVAENARTAEDARPGAFQAEDFALIDEVRTAIRAGEKVGCTGCRYCMPCPHGVDIPGIFRSWNTMYTETKHAGRWEIAQTVSLTRSPVFATACVGCGKCEKHCPQSIPIRQKLKEADRDLRPLPYRIGLGVARRFMLRGGKAQK